MKMMQSSELAKQLVNGGMVFIPTQSQWMTLLQEPLLDDQPIGVIDLAQRTIKLATAYPMIVPALHRPSSFLPWLPITVLHHALRFQRVQIEYRRCEQCLWQGIVATPTVLSLYFGTADPYQEYTVAFQLPALPCPNCGQRLSGHPIWVGDDPSMRRTRDA